MDAAAMTSTNTIKMLCNLLAESLGSVVENEFWSAEDRYRLVKNGVRVLKTKCPQTRIVKSSLPALEQDLRHGVGTW